MCPPHRPQRGEFNILCFMGLSEASSGSVGNSVGWHAGFWINPIENYACFRVFVRKCIYWFRMKLGDMGGGAHGYYYCRCFCSRPMRASGVNTVMPSTPVDSFVGGVCGLHGRIILVSMLSHLKCPSSFTPRVARVCDMTFTLFKMHRKQTFRGFYILLLFCSEHVMPLTDTTRVLFERGILHI